MKKINRFLLLAFLICCTGCSQGKNIITENMAENTSIAEMQKEMETISDLPELDPLEVRLDHMGNGYGESVKYDGTSEKNEQLHVESQMWQDAYAELLQDSSGNDFYLCDIDGDGIPELLIGGPSTDTYKHAEFNTYTYKGSKVECLGIIGTLRSSSLWLDGNGGILGYSYGAGGGGTYRYYIENDILNYGGEVSGYYYDREGNYTEWFTDTDGSEIIVTEENRYEYESIWSNMREAERYIVTDDTILMVIYGGG